MTNIKDLAKMSGVSVSTVSRVLNNHPYVSAEKRAAVLKAIEFTNYNRNINAVHLSRGKTQLMGVVLPFTDTPYFALLLKGIAKRALENDYKLVLFQTDYAEEKEIEALQMLKQKQIDSLIICSRKCDLALIQEHIQYGTIVLCEKTTEKSLPSVFIDHYEIFFQALEYLYQKGHKKIGYSVARKTGSNSSLREQAYRDFLKKYKLPFYSDYIMDDCLYFEDGEKVMQRLRSMDIQPTALIITSDQVAAGIMIECQKEGISIPEQLAVIGFNNEPIAKMMNITTIDIPLVELGGDLFLQAYHGYNSNKQISVKLIERETV